MCFRVIVSILLFACGYICIIARNISDNIQYQTILYFLDSIFLTMLVSSMNFKQNVEIRKAATVLLLLGIDGLFILLLDSYIWQ